MYIYIYTFFNSFYTCLLSLAIYLDKILYCIVLVVIAG